MLNDLKAQAAYEADEMERLKAEGREKSATYRQFFGNRLFYKQLLNTYKKYGLMDEAHPEENGERQVIL
jgi:hypothetical protein